MLTFLARLFDASGFAARSQDAGWPPGLAWLHNTADALLGLAAFALAFLLLYVMGWRRRDTPFYGMFVLFAAFLVADGVTRFLEVLTFFTPVYRLSGLVKLLAAIVAWTTLGGLVLSIPKALALRNPQALEQTIAERAEAQIQAALREKELLLKEIHHRVKNNLQVIYSLLSLQSEYVRDERSLELFRESQNRIKSMALIHQELYKSGDVETVDFAAYVRDLVANLFRSYGVRAPVIRTRIEITDVFLPLQTAIPCGLILNELVANALKYAFPAGQPGEIHIAFHPDPAAGFILIIADNGIGLPTDLDFRNTESLGLRLVVTLTEQLQGAIERLPESGTAFRITFPGTGTTARGGRHEQEHDLGCRG
jgi:two-component sensor histidine kinase